MNKEQIRAYIKLRTALNMQPKSIFDELCTALRDQAPSCNTVVRWSKLCREGREEVEDEPRLGRPVTETTSDNIEKVLHLIDSGPYFTIDEIQVETGLSHGTAQRIVSDHLKLKKITARWIPNQLTDSQRAERVRICQENLAKFNQGTWRLCDVVTGDESWFYHKQLGRKSSNAAWTASGETPPTVVRRSHIAPKTEQTIDHDYYINNCLQPLVNEIKKQRPSSGTHAIKIHHDNARPHVHKDVSTYLESQGIMKMLQPPNSPDLAPCDFWLFDLIKQNLTDQRSSVSLHRAVTKVMFSINEDEYKKTFDKWIERMKLCVYNHGDYFEHLIK
ncbi:unnamed protein product [Rotaria socialis]|uniref:Transposase n=1 Tax=Rotaria socialis TaxID=392032 RepID=A0A818B6C8_9BILA|nr:unnamed protein product [Rotaria socialis]CAF4615498.1 unnamed protein product [Rotaria socialis]